jgi:pimeloyl-ACP methyl ester carboxylesterase
MPPPQTQYARSGEVNIAYQVVGDGPRDLVYVPGTISHLEWAWEEPSLARFYERLASFSRLIVFDKRGTGMSERVEVATPEQRIDDIRTVMDAAGSERAAVMGVSEGGTVSALFAATYPDRVSSLILYASAVAGLPDDDFPWAPRREDYEEYQRQVAETWPNLPWLNTLSPSTTGDERYGEWRARMFRYGATPAALIALDRMNMELDVRSVLPTIHVPTLVLHRNEDTILPVEGSRYLAERVPTAKYVELAGVDHAPWVGDSESIVSEVEEFLTGLRTAPPLDRVLSTILFTDIVRSTEVAASLGDRRWADLVSQHHAVVRRQLGRFRGSEIDTAGDGFFASFDGPARAIHCAEAVVDSVEPLGLDVRAGIHTGECQLIDGKLGGIAVVTGSRVAAIAGAAEILVTSTVKALVAGSGIALVDRGTVKLKGVPDEWHLFAVQR